MRFSLKSHFAVYHTLTEMCYNRLKDYERCVYSFVRFFCIILIYMRCIESRKKQKSQYWREASVESLETFDKLLKAAKRGNIAAQYKVSECYKTGEMGVQINKTEAEKWYSRAIRREKSVLQHTSCK